MPKFEKTPAPNPLPQGWVKSTKFASKGRLVGEDGRKVTADSQGRKYQLVQKIERDFSTGERIGRVALGVVIVALSLFTGLFSKSVRNLFTGESKRFGVEVLNKNEPNLTEQFDKFAAEQSQKRVELSTKQKTENINSSPIESENESMQEDLKGLREILNY